MCKLRSISSALAVMNLNLEGLSSYSEQNEFLCLWFNAVILAWCSSDLDADQMEDDVKEAQS